MSTGRVYTMRSFLGKGTYGVVYGAVLHAPSGFTKEVAIKVLSREACDNEEIARRFRDEARLLALVRHRAIVQVDALLQVHGRWAVVMEHVEGANLLELVRTAAIPLGPALDIVAEVAAALHSAFTQPGPDGRPLRLLHRDIKPSNVQITATGSVKLLDFGIARAEFEGREADTQSLLLGSRAYMAPERLDGADGPAGDIYALGAVLYQMLARRGLGETSTDRAAHAAHLRRAFATLDGHPEPIVSLIRRLLAFDPSHRPTARELQRDCARLREQLAADRLADWSEPIIRSAIAQRTELEGDSLVGESIDASARSWPATLAPAVGRSDLPPQHDVETETRAARRYVPFAAGLLGAVVPAAAALAMAARVWPGENLSEHAELEDEPMALAEALPAPPEEPAQAPAEPEPTPPRPATRANHRAPIREQPLPEPLPGRVTVSGDAVSVRLLGPAGTTGPGMVPVGHYRAYASFDGVVEVPAGRFEVTPGQSVRLHCTAATETCVPR